ncbi:MAG: hypothetical protein BWK80_01755 [Desulfobacteraceae bacterium IS3]|nr:MAG: hypothetical protein BWK80_01755 [Desulfobacteraceae bacterium IS3]
MLSPAGTAEPRIISRPYRTDRTGVNLVSGNELPGYSQKSLRDSKKYLPQSPGNICFQLWAGLFSKVPAGL